MTDEVESNEGLSQLSCHYDSMLWTVTSLWAAAIGGLLVYCTSSFDRWLSLLGLALTVCAMAFASSFRNVRGRVQAAMKNDLRELHRSRGMFRQWPWFLGVFLALVAAWTRLLVEREEELICVWLGLGTFAAAIITWFWWHARWGLATEGSQMPKNSLQRTAPRATSDREER